MKKIIYLLVGIVLFGGLYYSCAPEELPGSIYGTVVDKATGEPIKSAGVELSPSGLKTVTGSEGQFEFTELDPGKYTLIITKTGYVDGVSGTIEVKPGQQAKGDVQIEKLPPALKVVNDNREEISILDFGSAEDDVARSFSVFNDGTESLEWELTATADWIKSVSKTNGTLSAGATQSLIITIDRAKLSSGENKTTVHITSNSGNKQLVVTATNNFQLTKLNVLPTTAITSTSATLNGEIVEDGSPIYTERGFVYAETTQPTISACIQKIATPFSDSKTFAATVSDLVEGKKYYVRAYAIQSGKEVYSANEVSFTAEGSVLPKVTTKSITDISRSEGKAIAMGTITEVGDPAYSERGFVYNTTHNPIIQTATKTVVEGNGIGEFVATLSDLQLGNMYYVRAYAKNTVGVAYGEEQTLDFNPILPEVATNDVTGISEETKSATFHATITNAGDPVYTERGFVYGKSPDPTTGGATKLVVAGSGTGTYYGDVHNLEVDCAYYVRAYVTYSSGTVYGENKVFSVKKMYPPTVTTSAVTNINKTTATAGGNVTDDGGVSVTERGVVYSTNQTPTIVDNKVSSGNGKGAYTCNLTNLQEATTYYVRAYAINEKGTAYGEEVSFTTSKEILLPSVTTSTITQVTETTAVAGGNVTSDGGASVTERGVCIATVSNPTTSHSKITAAGGTGTFTCAITGLQEGTTYYVRAYATNSKGTAYGEQVSFTTAVTISLPSVTTSTITQITETTALAGGNVTSDGKASVTERGVVYSLSANPTISDLGSTIVRSGSGTGSFTCELTNLQAGTKYYVRAYAMNVVGIGYGEQVDFTVSTGTQTITVNGVSFTMIAVQGGTFTMGATSEQGSDAYSDEKPTHQVTLSDYYIGETEVTQELWQAVMGSNPSYFSGTNLPVEKVSWNDCQTFITKLNQLTGKKFRLPTEAEWEYAARGGQKSKGYKYAGSNTLSDVAWYDGNSSSKTHPVKQKQANELGIYDMSGNVYEWCQDWYGSYSSSVQTNPTGPSSGSYRVSRGGGWFSYASICRVSDRHYGTPTITNYDLGLRLAL